MANEKSAPVDLPRLPLSSRGFNEWNESAPTSSRRLLLLLLRHVVHSAVLIHPRLPFFLLKSTAPLYGLSYER
jgi:hypothetical protein